jgi:hypothetical protein
VTALWYWLVFALAALLIAGSWLAAAYERRQNRRDAELWRRRWSR